MCSEKSTIGEKLKITVYGASHAEKIGVIIEGFPKGFKIDFDRISVDMARRAPGNIAYSTARKEPDIPKLLSGVDENGVTDGEVIEAAIFNTNQHSGDYDALKYTPRPGHADYTAYVKFGGKLDMHGGGKFSGRLTAPIVFAGSLCRQLLGKMGITVAAHVLSIGDVEDERFDSVNADIELLNKLNRTAFPVIDFDAKQKMLRLMENQRMSLDSVGGRVECMIAGLPVGIGDSLFDGIDGKIAQYVFGIPAIKGVEFGNGFAASQLFGSQNNDPFTVKDGKIVTETNNCGGVLGGITNGMPLVFTAAFKPTPSISREQKTVNLQTMQTQPLNIKGRHDPCVVPRGAAVVEAVAAIAVADRMLCEDKINWEE